MIIDLMRHGSTGRPGFMDGTMDLPLSENGWAAFESATIGKTWGMIVTSPLRRARDAAERLAKAQAIDMEIDPCWQEMNFGRWDGLARAAIEADEAERDALAAFYRDPGQHTPPGGELWVDLQRRVGTALRALAKRDSASPTLVITHAGPMRVALAQACGLPFERLWAIRIGYATRVRLQIGIDTESTIWGEIIEIRQP